MNKLTTITDRERELAELLATAEQQRDEYKSALADGSTISREMEIIAWRAVVTGLCINFPKSPEDAREQIKTRIKKAEALADRINTLQDKVVEQDAEIERLTANASARSTGACMRESERTIAQQAERIAELERSISTDTETIVRLHERIAAQSAALSLLSEAADDIESWGAYASEYFRAKHDLAGCVAKYRAAADALEQQSRNP